MAQTVKNLPKWGRHGFDPWVRKIPWRRAWQPTPVFLPGESPWTEEPGGHSPWGCTELDATEPWSQHSTAQHMYGILSSAKSDSFTSSFPVCKPCIYFHCLISLTRTQKPTFYKFYFILGFRSLQSIGSLQTISYYFQEILPCFISDNL